MSQSEMDPRIVHGLETPTHIARVLSPKGIYPAQSAQFSEGVYVANKEICFSLVTYHEPYEEDPYSEVQWLTVSEIRIYGALMLSVNREAGGYSAFYPYPHSLSLDCSNIPDIIGLAADLIRPILIEKLCEPDIHHPGFIAPARNPYRYTTDIPLPPIAGGPSYQLRETGIDYQLAQELFSAILPDDPLAMRGLSTFIKAAMLHFHYQFFEEALNTLYISLKRPLGNPQPTAKDAANFIHDAFDDVNRWGKYFEEDYERRIISFHPESRLGVYAHPPMMADDYYDLFEELPRVYRFLLLGYVHPMDQRKAAV